MDPDVQTAMLLTQREWDLLAAVCDNYLAPSNHNTAEARALCHRIIDACD